MQLLRRWSRRLRWQRWLRRLRRLRRRQHHRRRLRGRCQLDHRPHARPWLGARQRRHLHGGTRAHVRTAAEAGVGPGREFRGRGFGPLHVADQARRDRQHDLGFLVVVALGAEQAAQDRQVAGAGDLVAGAALLVVDQARQHLVLAILQLQGGAGLARAKLIRGAAIPGRQGADQVAHLELHLDGDFVVEVNGRLHRQLQAHVHVGHALAGKAAHAARHGRRDHRQLVADDDIGLLLVAHADARIGQQVRVGIGLVDVDRAGDAGQQDAVRVQVAQLIDRRTIGKLGQRRDADTARPLHAQVHQRAAFDLEDFHLQHHFRLGHVLGGDHAFGQADRFRVVAHDQQVELFIDHHVARFKNRLEGVGHHLGVGIGQVEGLDRHLLVFLLLGGRVRIDQHGVGVHHLLFELVGQQQEIDRRLHRAVAQQDRGALVGLDVLVEHEVQVGPARDHLEDLLQGRVAELDGDRLLVRFCQAGFGGGRRGFFGHFAQQLARRLVRRRLGQQGIEALLGQVVLALGHVFAGDGQQLGVALVTLERAQPGAGALVGRVERQRAAPALLGQFRLAVGRLAFGFTHKTLDGAVARLHVGGAVFGVGRFGLERLLVLEQTRLHLVLRHQRVAVAVGHLAGAAPQRQHQGQQRRQCQPPAVLFQMTRHHGSH